MAVKVFGATLMFSYFFLCIMGEDLNITDEQFDNFKGIDAGASCGNTQAMKDMCNQIGKTYGATDGTKAFRNGYPACAEKKIQVIKKGTQEPAYRKANLPRCSWEGETYEDYYSKGQNPNRAMNYNCAPPNGCIPFTEMKLK